MHRKVFLKTLTLLPLTGIGMELSDLRLITENLPKSKRMPVLFVGHGSPMNAIEDNIFTRNMKKIGRKIPPPNAILMVSAHWETKGTFVTAQDNPPTIHDFGGFPKALFEVQYPAPGSKWLAGETQKVITSTPVGLSEQWGFDHGAWSVTKNLFPDANIPMIQLSLDFTGSGAYHYELAKQLATLRDKGVLIIGSGNMVHNFSYAQVKGMDFNQPFGHDWALEANDLFKQYIVNHEHAKLADYKQLGKPVQLAVPTPEHYLPLLYVLGVQHKDENITFFNDVAIAGSFTMTSVMIG
ncbi:MAG: 4,5-DOPA dioxygenase extradiol [Cytophagales bacterium]|nr:4,5-DOPA dioxygenase extradiol [Cytophagales bacterium]